MRTSRKPRLPTEERLTRAALHYLERYPSSSANLRKVLERRVMKACRFHERDPEEFSEFIDATLDKCIRAGLVNDATYAETKAFAMKRRGASSRKIQAYLTAKGVDRGTIETVLQSEDQDELSSAFIYARRRRLGPFRKSADRTERRDKDMAALCRAGFSFELARQVVDSSQETLEERGLIFNDTS
ncbi:MAG: regulatory protein RecX [Roseibium sp.]|nr:regulatory protein RecX [Roseibium sp.]MBO6932549.1 regulatory protein RecX [Roseibium sp.]